MSWRQGLAFAVRYLQRNGPNMGLKIAILETRGLSHVRIDHVAFGQLELVKVSNEWYHCLMKSDGTCHNANGL